MHSLESLCDLSYQRRVSGISRQPVPGHEATYKFYHNKEQVFFISNALPRDKVLDGWVFQILVPQSHIEKAWQCLYSTLLHPQHGSLGFAIIDPDAEGAVGRRMSLYTFRDANGELCKSQVEMCRLLVKIENLLRDNDIPSAFPSRATQTIPGSRYVTYRNDRHPETGEFLSPDAALACHGEQAFNPFDLPNPYAGFQMMPKQHSLQKENQGKVNTVAEREGFEPSKRG